MGFMGVVGGRAGGRESEGEGAIQREMLGLFLHSRHTHHSFGRCRVSAGAFNEGYQAGAHWYTNDLNMWQPEFNRLEGLQFWWSVIGMAIGALPTQTDCCVRRFLLLSLFAVCL